MLISAIHQMSWKEIDDTFFKNLLQLSKKNLMQSEIEIIIELMTKICIVK